MEFRKLTAVVVVVSLLTTTFAEKYDEPMCTSRFDFEDKLLNKMVRMEHAMELLQERVGKVLTDMEQGNLQIKQDVNSFKASVKDEQTKVLDDLKRTNEELKQEGKKLAEGIETLSQQTEDKVQRMSRDLAVSMNKSDDDKVVFAVQQATGNLVNGVPTFSKVHVNVGGAYDVSTGKFTCNVKGLYTFTFIVRSTSVGYVSCHIRKNRSSINRALSEGKNDMSSVTVYLDLVVSDVVDLGSCAYWNERNTVKNTASFSGMKI